ncbi:hypothetical protein [Croceicoccus bisphenolivorans]|uniref:hypothetical protein n=1 Tax=Croceicoccus bisphenolivorans TaxID=1783232 RepID=UPI00082B0FA2|nr:hypothetical protein [Croceicoccus bisphenolivorans]
MNASLPQKFRELEEFTAWALPTERERYDRRAGSTLEELNVFYSAMKPHMEEVIRYLEGFAWGTELSAEDQRLYHMGLSYMEAAVPIELKWKSAVAEDSFPVARLTLPQTR